MTEPPIAAAFYLLKQREDRVEGLPDTGVVTSEPSRPVVSGDAEAREGTLGSGDEVAPDGSWYDEYPLSGPQGSSFIITMRSRDFDAYLTVVAPSGATYSDDDSGGGTDSRLEVTLDEPGTWLVWANTLRVGDTGTYTLSIARAP